MPSLHHAHPEPEERLAIKVDAEVLEPKPSKTHKAPKPPTRYYLSRDAAREIESFRAEFGKDGEPMSQNELARLTGVNSGIVSQLLSSSGYPGDGQKYEDRMVTAIFSRRQGRRQAHMEVDTPLQKRFVGIAELGKTLRSRMVMEASPGIGTSTVAASYAATMGNTILVRAALGIRCTKGQIFRAIRAQQTRTKLKKNDDVYALVLDDLKGTDRLVIIDHAHALGASALWAVASLAQEADVALILIGPPGFGEVLKGLQRPGEVFPCGHREALQFRKGEAVTTAQAIARSIAGPIHSRTLANAIAALTAETKANFTELCGRLNHTLALNMRGKGDGIEASWQMATNTSLHGCTAEQWKRVTHTAAESAARPALPAPADHETQPRIA